MASVMSKKSPAQPGIFALVREFFGNATGHGDLLISFVHADLHARHRDKALGVLWTVGDPLMMMLVYVFIVTMVFKHHSADYPIYVYSGLISWRYFAHCTQGASAALASKGGLLTQAYFPRVLIPLAHVIEGAYEFFFSWLVLVGLFILLRVGVSWEALLVPAIFLLQSLFNVGLALMLSAIGISFRDLPNILAFVIRFGWYLSPGLYHVEHIPERFQSLYMLNPMAIVFTLYRDVTLYQRLPDLFHVLYFLSLSIVMFVAGIWVFHRQEGVFTKYL